MEETKNILILPLMKAIASPCLAEAPNMTNKAWIIRLS